MFTYTSYNILELAYQGDVFEYKVTISTYWLLNR